MTFATDAPPDVSRLGLTLEDPPLLRERVARSICQAVLNGALEPGQRLVETRIASELGVGRNAVREALQQLEQQGIVAGSAYKGVRVADIGPQQIEEVYSLRATLETFATVRALQRGKLTDTLLHDLDVLIAEMSVAAQFGGVTRMVELDMAFHDRITSCADHALVMPVLKGLRQQVRIIIALSSRGSGLRQMVESHRVLLDVLTTRDPARIEAATMTHILESGELMAQLRSGVAPADEPGGTSGATPGN